MMSKNKSKNKSKNIFRKNRIENKSIVPNFSLQPIPHHSGQKVSLIIITWNRLDDLKKCLPGWLSQDYKNQEIIIVDNGSVDGTLEYLGDLVKTLPQIKVIENGKNLGTSVGRNIGIKQATGEYLFMVDNDIQCNNNSLLSDLVGFYESLDNPGFVNVLLLDKEHMIDGITRWYGSYYRIYGVNRNRSVLIDKLLRLDPPIQTSVCFSGDMFVRRQLMLDLGLFDESQLFNIDDDDISTRALVWGYKNYLYTKDYLLHLGFHTNQSNETYTYRFSTYFSGKARPIFKNMQWSTIFFMFPTFCTFTFILGLKHAIIRRCPRIILAYYQSIGVFIKNFGSTMSERKRIQAKRCVRDRDVLFFKPPIKGI